MGIKTRLFLKGPQTFPGIVIFTHAEKLETALTPSFETIMKFFPDMPIPLCLGHDNYWIVNYIQDP